MSGYLEVKYPFKSNLGLNPFKSWKRQWCILRPSPTFSGGVLAVYCSEAGAAAGTIDLPTGFIVRRAKSRTRPHAFAVFPTDDPRKPRVLLAASTLNDAQTWMEKIKLLISGTNLLESEGTLKDTYSVTVKATELSRKCGLSGSDSTVSITPAGLHISHAQRPVLVQWKHISDATVTTDNGKHGTCILTVDSGFSFGGGSLQLWSPLAGALLRSLARGPLARALSKSDSELSRGVAHNTREIRRSSWYSGPSEVSLDDLDLVMPKEPAISALSRCRAVTLPTPSAGLEYAAPGADDSGCDRRSVASGIYEEIAEEPLDGVYCTMRRPRPSPVLQCPFSEPAYESVSECVYATLRPRRAPPPLPPRRAPSGAGPLACRAGSLGSLPPAARTLPRWDRSRHAFSAFRSGAGPLACRAGSLGSLPPAARTLPRWDRSRHAFSAFRKRLKSDSRVVTSPKSETSKEKDVETKKKRFEFTPTRDIFKSFKVSKKMKNLKIAPGTLGQGETKSCEFLDETEHITANRCSKSVECLEDNYLDLDSEHDLSIELEQPVSLTLPQDIVQLILQEHEKISQLRAKPESDYMPMSPIVPPAEHHYIVMSPRTNMA